MRKSKSIFKNALEGAQLNIETERKAQYKNHPIKSKVTKQHS